MARKGDGQLCWRQPRNNALWCGNKRGSRYVPIGGASLHVDGTVMVLWHSGCERDANDGE